MLTSKKAIYAGRMSTFFKRLLFVKIRQFSDMAMVSFRKIPALFSVFAFPVQCHRLSTGMPTSFHCKADAFPVLCRTACFARRFALFFTLPLMRGRTSRRTFLSLPNNNNTRKRQRVRNLADNVYLFSKKKRNFAEIFLKQLCTRLLLA